MKTIWHLAVKNHQIPWVINYIWMAESEKIELPKLLEKKMKERNIYFDERQSIIYNPSEFIDSPLFVNNHYEIAHLEGTSTINHFDRHYSDIILIRERKSSTCLYAEYKGPILNGFLEALSFEKSLINMELHD